MITRIFVQNRFRKEIVLIIVLKIFALCLIWGLFFSHPVADTLKKNGLVQHFLHEDMRT